MKTAIIEPDHRIQLPADWLAKLGMGNVAALEQRPDGILIKPCPPSTWDAVYADKLVIGSTPPPGSSDNEIEVSNDDLLF